MDLHQGLGVEEEEEDAESLVKTRGERGEREKEEWIWEVKGKRRREVEEQFLRTRVAIEAKRRLKNEKP